MSRCVNLNHARAKAASNALESSMNRREIFSYSGSKRKDKSVVNIVGLCFTLGSKASGMMASPSLATHWWAPAGLLVNSHSWPNRMVKYWLLHFVGVAVQVTSKPEVIASLPLPDL